jgi:hypothetical protein
MTDGNGKAVVKATIDEFPMWDHSVFDALRSSNDPMILQDFSEEQLRRAHKISHAWFQAADADARKWENQDQGLFEAAATDAHAAREYRAAISREFARRRKERRSA